MVKRIAKRIAKYVPHRAKAKVKNLASKVKRRLKKLLLKNVPYNDRYKPVSVTSLFSHNNQGIEMLMLRKPYVSTLELDNHFIMDCSPFSKPVMSVEMPGDYIVTLKNGRVFSWDGSNMAVISSDNKLINELSFTWNGEAEKIVYGKNNAIFKLKSVTRPRKYSGKVFSLLSGGGSKYYYYHWMIDSIAKLGLLKESGKFDEVDYFLVPNYQARYHKEYLNHFGITEDKIINNDLVDHIEADYLMVSSFVQIEFHHPKWAIDFLYNSFITPDKNRKTDKLIYIPRGDAAVNRKVLNENELMQALKNLGFEIHYLADMTVPEEAKLLNSARLVVGVQGSGFANLVFCEPGTKVLEIFPETYVRHIDYDICNKRGLEFHYIICPSDAIAIDTVQGQTINVIADIPRITRKIRQLLAIPVHQV